LEQTQHPVTQQTSLNEQGATHLVEVERAVDKNLEQRKAKCQQMHFTSFAIAVPLYPALYTYVGIYPESDLARHTQPNPSNPKDIGSTDAPDTWRRLVEDVSWEA
jgi:hypothetical protein